MTLRGILVNSVMKLKKIQLIPCIVRVDKGEMVGAEGFEPPASCSF